ncbi:hypothetical protein COCNU_06G006920 [Cocos nucifera]|uniref:F-box domain-containing protein n=1 Tax=Cocos nucifera TaxID=13894 RepID=A0A8K0IAR4_COCNU|nr:hypothetical protein COCNU_06G006920 [Cocos nucifera]
MPAKKRLRLSALESDVRSGPDLIGLLPDCILTQILSLLSLKESARTSVLSTCWRHLWTLVPLHLLDDDSLHFERAPCRSSHAPRSLTDDEAWCARSITQILSSHPGPIHSCRLVRRFSDLPAVDGWIQALTQKDIQQFFVSFFGSPEPHLLPSALFRSESLRKLNLGNCRFPWMPEGYSTRVLGVHSLKILGIRVDFNEEYQRSKVSLLLKCFPCLERLDVEVVDMGWTYALQDLKYWERQGSFDCIDQHLRSVTLKGFLGHAADLGFVRFLISNARVLEVMTLYLPSASRKTWMKDKRSYLCLDNRASFDARVYKVANFADIIFATILAFRLAMSGVGFDRE